MLGGVADTVAQLITAVKARSSRKVSIGDDGLISTKARGLHNEKLPSIGELGHVKTSPIPFDFERVTRFIAYGFIMAPLQLKWFGFLSKAFPLTQKNPTVPVLKRVALDQFIFAPFGMVLRFPFGSTPSVLTLVVRSGLLFQFHDRRGRWEQKEVNKEILRCLSADSKGQLCSLAGGADTQLPCPSSSIPNR